ncbi:hypothetical protein AAF712_007848 [Marasmius tenuissimus]|uniref:F-box domain-containing protein n=1 Tax=Marasmius tenuissimus TaxID=585030 RepID=A0ABR2ZWL0_9AGAR
MPRITDLPVELHIDNFLPILPLKDLLNLGATNKHFATLCNDNTLWKRKLDSDFNFNGANTARTTGWKFIYLRLTNPRVYVWGNTENGRLGLSSFPKSSLSGVPFPAELRFPGTRIVNLVAGGMSFHALDAEGRVHVWGTLDGTSYALNSDGYYEPAKSAHSPLRLQLPSPTRSISCGRLHSCTLDSQNSVWNFLCWGRPFRLISDHFSPAAPPLQIECGWAFSSALMESGAVTVWWPFSGSLKIKYDQKMAEMDAEGDKQAVADEGMIPCHTFEIKADPFVLPHLPSLPDLPIEDKHAETRVIQIAAYDNHLIALTNNGHVLMFDSLDGEDSVSRGRWNYLPNFSNVNKVRTHPTFTEGKAAPPKQMQITHVSAHFQHFIAYSTGASSMVLMGDMGTTTDSQPQIIPELQNRSVISVVLGDYHSGALTADGKLLTWGAFSRGALGLGDPTRLEVGAPGGFATEDQRLRAVERHAGEPPAVEVPTEVRFDHKRKKPKDRFCISAAASGWHMGALVIDLEPNENEDDSDIEEGEDEQQPRTSFLGRPPRMGIPTDPFFRGVPPFRVGFPGRGH